MRVDVVPARRGHAELLAKLSDEDIDRTVAVGHRVTPDPLVDLFPPHNTVGLDEQLEDLEFTCGEIDADLSDERLMKLVPDQHLARNRRRVEHDQLAAAVPAQGRFD